MKLIMLAGEGKSTNIVYNSLKSDYCIDNIIIEESVYKNILLKRRIKRLGYFKVFGQILFKAAIFPYLERISISRITEIKEKYGLDEGDLDSAKIINVPSVNSEYTISILRKINPDIVIVNGTRIISKEVLGCIPAKFINMHVGITPLYRGVYGAYWALVENNRQACGVTIHLVDPGIDTGNILAQGIINPTGKDNCATYQMLQLAVGIDLLKKVVSKGMERHIEIRPDPVGRSKLWSHPTIWEYLYFRILYGVR